MAVKGDKPRAPMRGMAGRSRYVIAFSEEASRMLDQLADWWQCDFRDAATRAVKDVYYEHKRAHDRDVCESLKREARRALRKMTPLEAELRVAGDTPISGRLLNALVNKRITSFAMLVERYTEEDILGWRHVGAGTMHELRGILRELDLPLRSEVEKKT